MSYDPNKHLMKIGGKDYLPVAQRVVWFREQHPDWGIRTEAAVLDLEAKVAVFRATITNPNGEVMAQGTKIDTLKQGDSPCPEPSTWWSGCQVRLSPRAGGHACRALAGTTARSGVAWTWSKARRVKALRAFPVYGAEEFGAGPGLEICPSSSSGSRRPTSATRHAPPRRCVPRWRSEWTAPGVSIRPGAGSHS